MGPLPQAAARFPRRRDHRITGIITAPASAGHSNVSPPTSTLDQSQIAIILLSGILGREGLSVRVISRRRLRQFWESRKKDAAVAKRDLSVWYKLARSALWANFGALRQTFGSADLVGNCAVFDVGNNRYRLIGRVNYVRHIVYVLRVMDHMEYDRRRWVEDCGCHEPPPTRPATAKRVPSGGSPPQRRRKEEG
jgi:mRNA interferase HigB